MKTTIQSKSGLAAACNVNRGTVYTWLLDPTFPKRSAKGWNTADVLKYSKRQLAEAAEHQTPGPGDDAELLALRKDVLRRRIAMLDQEIRESTLEADIASGATMSMEGHREVFRNVAGVVTGGLQRWVGIVERLKDVRLKHEAETIRDEIRQYLTDGCGKIEDDIKKQGGGPCSA